MNDFFQSKFMTDLKNGELPTIEVEIGTQSILILAGSILLVGVILIVGKSLVK